MIYLRLVRRKLIFFTHDVDKKSTTEINAFKTGGENMKKYKLGALKISDKELQDTKEEIVIELNDRMQRYVA